MLMSNIKELRNKQIVRMRLKDPKKWTFERIAEHFNITRQTAHEIFVRETVKDPA